MTNFELSKEALATKLDEIYESMKMDDSLQSEYKDGAKDVILQLVDYLESGLAELDFNDWVKLGFDAGWVGPPICETHDGLPLTEAEEAEFEYNDPCIHILRLYDSEEDKAEIEANHAPSVWRQSSYGLAKPSGEDDA